MDRERRDHDRLPGQHVPTEGHHQPGSGPASPLPPARALRRVPASESSGFTDIPAWLTEAVEWGTYDPAGALPPIMAGYPDDTFRPNRDITRAQTTRAVCRAARPRATANGRAC